MIFPNPTQVLAHDYVKSPVQVVFNVNQLVKTSDIADTLIIRLSFGRWSCLLLTQLTFHSAPRGPRRLTRRLPWPLVLTLFIGNLALAALHSGAAYAGSAPISHISKKNAVVIKAGSDQGLAIGDRVCFLLPVRKVRGCATVRRLKRGYAAVRVRPDVAAELTVGMLTDFVPSKPGAGSPEQQRPNSKSETDDSDINLDQDESLVEPADEQPSATHLPSNAVLGLDLGIGQEVLADNLTPASFNATGPVVSVRARGRYYFGATSSWSLRLGFVQRSFAVALAKRSTDASQAGATDIKTFNESDLRLAVAKDLLDSPQQRLELGLGGVYKRLPAALSVSTNGEPTPGLLALSGPIALLSYTVHIAPHDLNAVVTVVPLLVGKKAKGRALGVSGAFHQALTPEWQLSYEAAYEQWSGTHPVSCPAAGCSSSSRFKDTSIELILGLLRWF